MFTHENQQLLEKLKDLRNKVNWNIEEERCNFLVQFYLILERNPFSSNIIQLFLHPKEIECLLWDSINYKDKELNYNPGNAFIVLASNCYKDEPEVDENGIISPRRTTPIHHAVKNSKQLRDWDQLFFYLFEIYGRFDVNYTDESGCTHVHAACQFNCNEVVQKFLEHGQNPNCIWPETGDSPLHIALRFAEQKSDVMGLLLRRGANPNLANDEGSTSLHIICKRDQYYVDDLAELFFKINDELNQRVQVDARDKLGRTPLQWAVVSCLPHAVESVLNRGADLSSFVFPTLSQFDECFKLDRYKDIQHKLGLASGLLAVIECLEKRGYELDQRDALTIMKFFAKFELFQEFEDLEQRWYDVEGFNSKYYVETMVKSDLSLYDLIHLRPQEAAKRLTCMDYYELANQEKLWWIRSEKHSVKQAYCRHLCEMMSRKFFRSLALEPFWKLIHYRLPLECCELILENLQNKDLYHIFLAAAALVKIFKNKKL